MNKLLYAAGSVVLLCGLPFVLHRILASGFVEGPLVIVLACLPSVLILCLAAVLLVPFFFRLGDRSSLHGPSQAIRNAPGLGKFGNRTDFVDHRASKSFSSADRAEFPSGSLSGSCPDPFRDRFKQAADQRERDFEALRRSISGGSGSLREEDVTTAIDSPAPPPPQAVRFSAGKLETELSQMIESLTRRRQDILTIIKQAEEQLETVDECMLKHLPKNTTGSIQAVIQVRRIIEALENRVGQIETLLSEAQPIDPDQAHELLEGAVNMGEDSLSSLIDAPALPPLAPQDWRPALSSLFKRISRRRSIFRGTKFTFPDE